MSFKYMAIGFIVVVTVLFVFTWIKNEWGEGRCTDRGGRWDAQRQTCVMPPSAP
jgi:hypothetical protein